MGIEPYYESKLGKLYCGDCMEILPAVGSVNVVVSDPPYGIDYQSSRRTDSTARHKKIANDAQPFVWFLHPAFMAIETGGSIVVFCRWDVEHSFKQAIGWAGFDLKSQIIWDRESHGMGDLKAQFAPQHDTAWFATKGPYVFPGKRPASVIRSPRVSGEKMVHPNQKPVGLLANMIKSVSLSGPVLDPFIGSGTTAVACEQIGRQWIGIELSEKYCEIAAKRIEAEASQLKLF